MKCRDIRERWKNFCDRYVWIRACGGCSERMTVERLEEAFCAHCRSKWDRAKTENCPHCFGAAWECTCAPSMVERSGAAALRKLVFYRSERSREPQNRLLYNIKRRPNRRYSAFLAGELAAAAMEETRALGAEREDLLLTYIPRSRRSLMRYGHDQSALICQSLAPLLEVEYRPLVGRRFGGREQKRLTKRERLKNLQGLLYLREEDRSAVEGKTVLLVDDIVTTGASMAAGVSLLRSAGAVHVICLAIAVH